MNPRLRVYIFAGIFLFIALIILIKIFFEEEKFDVLVVSLDSKEVSLLWRYTIFRKLEIKLTKKLWKTPKNFSSLDSNFVKKKVVFFNFPF